MALQSTLPIAINQLSAQNPSDASSFFLMKWWNHHLFHHKSPLNHIFSWWNRNFPVFFPRFLALTPDLRQIQGAAGIRHARAHQLRPSLGSGGRQKRMPKSDGPTKMIRKWWEHDGITIINGMDSSCNYLVMYHKISHLYLPYASCMEYLPTWLGHFGGKYW